MGGMGGMPNLSGMGGMGGMPGMGGMGGMGKNILFLFKVTELISYFSIINKFYFISLNRKEFINKNIKF